MKFSVLSVVVALSSVVAALTKPVGDQPTLGAVTKPGLNELVPVSAPYSITWIPTNPGNTVSLVLLRGPSTNIKFHSIIAEKIPNSGSYSWTPPATLEPDTTHYGIQLIDDVTGAYQYTTQFGISNSKPTTPKPEEPKPEEPKPEEPKPEEPKPEEPKPEEPKPEEPKPSSTTKHTVTYSTAYETITSCDCTEPTAVPTGGPLVPSASGGAPPFPAHNTSFPIPTANASVPPPVQYEGAAASVKVAGTVFAVAAAGVAFALL